MNTKLLEKWKLQPNINPLTNRKIKINGPTYKKYEKMYNKFFQDKVCNYTRHRKDKIDPLTLFQLELSNSEIFKYEYEWNPYTGEKLNIKDPNGPLCFDPNNLIHFFYLNRLKYLWTKGHYEGLNYIQGHFGDAVGNGPDFEIVNRGKHPDWYLFRLPIIDEYLKKDHCLQSVTMGPILSDKEIKLIQKLSDRKRFRITYGYRRPNLFKMKKIYERAINKNDNYDEILGDIPKNEIKEIKYNVNTNAVKELIRFR